MRQEQEPRCSEGTWSVYLSNNRKFALVPALLLVYRTRRAQHYRKNQRRILKYCSCNNTDLQILVVKLRSDLSIFRTGKYSAIPRLPLERKCNSYAAQWLSNSWGFANHGKKQNAQLHIAHLDNMCHKIMKIKRQPVLYQHAKLGIAAPQDELLWVHHFWKKFQYSVRCNAWSKTEIKYQHRKKLRI